MLGVGRHLPAAAAALHRAATAATRTSLEFMLLCVRDSRCLQCSTAGQHEINTVSA